MKRKLRTQLSAGFVLIVLITIALISIAANLLINRQFEKYVAAQQKSFSDYLADALSYQYQADSDSWNTEYIHGAGMYALNDGYIIKLYDRNGETVWDAENHDMTYCHQVMDNIAVLMRERRRELDGQFIAHEYDLTHNGITVGKLDVSYYSPYYLNENAFRFLDSLNRILCVIGVFSIAGAAFAAVVLAKRLSAPIFKSIRMAQENRKEIIPSGLKQRHRRWNCWSCPGRLTSWLPHWKNRKISENASPLMWPMNCGRRSPMWRHIWKQSLRVSGNRLPNGFGAVMKRLSEFPALFPTCRGLVRPKVKT